MYPDAALYRGRALSQLRILKQQLALGGLKMGSRTVEIEAGVVVRCEINYDYEIADIFFVNEKGELTMTTSTTSTTTSSTTTTTTAGTTTTTTEGSTTTTTTSPWDTTITTSSPSGSPYYSDPIDEGSFDPGECNWPDDYHTIQVWVEIQPNDFVRRNSTSCATTIPSEIGGYSFRANTQYRASNINNEEGSWWDGEKWWDGWVLTIGTRQIIDCIMYSGNAMYCEKQNYKRYGHILRPQPPPYVPTTTTTTTSTTTTTTTPPP
jgi:hypothetical protein